MSVGNPDRDMLMAHGSFVRQLAVRLLGDTDAARDLEQATWLAAVQQKSAGPAASRSWLATVMRNAWHRRARTAERRERRESAAARPEAMPSTASVAARSEALRGVVDAVLELDEPWREVVLLRYFGDEPPRRIAEQLDLPVRTVRSRLETANEKLRQQLDQRFGRRELWAGPLLAMVRPPVVATATHAASGSLTQAASWVAIVAVVAGAGWWFMRDGESSLPGPADADPGVETVAGQERRGGQAELETSSFVPADGVPTDAAEGALVIEFFFADGTPMTDPVADVLVGGKVQSSGDEVEETPGEVAVNGPELTFAGGDGEARVFFSSTDRVAPFTVTLPRGRGRHRVMAPAEASVRGRIQREPGDTDPVMLVLLDPQGFPEPKGIPPAVRTKQGLDGNPRCLLACTSAEIFAFWNLRPNAVVELMAPDTHEFMTADGPRATIEVTAPVADPQLRLRHKTELRVVGRIAREDGGSVAESLSVVFAVGDRTLTSATPDDQGVFRCVLRGQHLEGTDAAVVVRVEDYSGIAMTRLEIPGPFTRERRDLGNVVIRSPRTVVFTIRDENGDPIPTARADAGFRFDAMRLARPKAADRSGRIPLSIPYTDTTVLVGAPGYGFRRVQVAATASEHVDVVLFPSADVRITATDAAGRNMLSHQARVELRLPGMSRDAAYVGRFQPLRSTGEVVGFTWRDDVFTIFGTAGRGAEPVLLADVPTGQMMEPVVVDRYCRVVARGPRFSVSPGERRDVTLIVRGPCGTVSGRVLDAASRPVVDQFVVVRPVVEPGSIPADYEAQRRKQRLKPGAPLVVGRTDADGRFALGPFLVPIVRLEVPAQGFAEVPARVLRVAEDSPQVIRLQAARTLVIDVVNARDGAPMTSLPRNAVLVVTDSLQFRARPAPGVPGRFLVGGLGPGPGRVLVRRGERVDETPLDGATTAVRITIDP